VPPETGLPSSVTVGTGARRVPLRALVLSVAALLVPVIQALVFSDSIGEYGAMLWLLPLLPAFLLAYYRGWRGVSLAFGGAVVALSFTAVAAELLGRSEPNKKLLLLVVGSYVGITLGIGWLAQVLRVTGQRHEEEARRRLETALETMQLGVTIVDVAGKILYANPADARQHGYTVAELIGQDIGVYSPGGRRRPMSPEELLRFSSWKRESRNARRDGTMFPVQLSSDVVFGLAGEPIGVVTTCEDITVRKATEEQLRQTHARLRQSHAALQAAQLHLIDADKMESVGRLAAGVAHEVKNPLMTLLTGVQYLQRFTPATNPQVVALLGDMREAVRRADAVIRGLLDFSAPRELDLEVQDLHQVVRQSLPLVKHELDRAQVTLATELGDDIPPLLLDAFKLQQVLINLITNAVHATPTGGRVTVRTTLRPLPLVSGSAPGAELQSGRRAVFIEVEDTGSGVPPDKLSKVFEPFFTTKPTGKGTGLGLSVSRQIVQMHGGTIQLENRTEGGARVTVVLPTDTQRSDHGQEEDPDS
jgi:PAS domain S-box-containing protein